jgi:hypothetical protein
MQIEFPLSAILQLRIPQIPSLFPQFRNPQLPPVGTAQNLERTCESPVDQTRFPESGGTFILDSFEPSA